MCAYVYIANTFSPLFTWITFTGIKGFSRILCYDVISNTKPLYCSKFDRCSSFG